MGYEQVLKMQVSVINKQMSKDAIHIIMLCFNFDDDSRLCEVSKLRTHLEIGLRVLSAARTPHT